MKKEIERKFLVLSDAYKKDAKQKTTITQGYLSKDPERIVRIRIQDQQAWITVKGKNSADGLTRMEWEQKIAKKEAEKLLDLCVKPLIHKTRYKVAFYEYMIEVDEFKNLKNSLVLAEIELHTENDKLHQLPHWIGEEVTGKPNYYNSNIKG